MSTQFRVDTTELEEQRSAIVAAGSALSLDMSTDGGTKTSKTVTAFTNAIKTANKDMTGLSNEVTSVGSDLETIKSLAVDADAAASKKIQGVKA